MTSNKHLGLPPGKREQLEEVDFFLHDIDSFRDDSLACERISFEIAHALFPAAEAR